MKKILKWVTIVVLIAVVVAFVYYSKTGPLSVQVLKVSKGDIREYIEDTAQVMLQDKQTAYIEGIGRVAVINVDVGDTVKKGDLLLSIQNDDFSLQLKDADAKIAQAKAQLTGTDLINYANKIELAEAEVTQAQIASDSAQRELDGTKKLYDAHTVSKNEYDKAQDAYKTAAAALATANIQLADVKQGAPEYLKNTYEAQLEQALISKENIQRNMQKTQVRAGIDGVILEKLVEKDVTVTASTPAFVIGNVSHLELESDILTDDISKVKIGNDVEISGKAIGDKVFKGKVIKLAPAAKTEVSSLGVNQNRIPVTIGIQDGVDQIKPGYVLDVKIITTAKSGIIEVPDSAVFDYQGKSDVFVAQNGKAVLRTIKKGIESDNIIEVIDGLKEGEVILSKPDNAVKEGIQIKAVY